ncbi:MAG TPA: YggS family pyridoxal phosphate-dependent enzyme [Verrucomicrobia bacterium]|nr:YggS family pyridoxal phosphate-dependent enzyme [Verrucomicrobiota bacterium]|tara:strand:+ start:148 stop:831 length:684 start_codon:yes stop_codon:yes gene_type:complete
MSEITSFEERLTTVQARIEKACATAGRELKQVRLLAVSKTKPPEAVEIAAQCGLRFFGENKVQEAQVKVPACSDDLQWHLIGHLQSNKAKLAAQLFHMIHSVDSLKLMRALDNHAEQTLPILLQVNVAGDVAKFGFKPEEAREALEKANESGHCEVHGLMTIPPFSADPEKTRAHFRALRELRDQLEQEVGMPLPELSMGMSHDLEVAIEEGSTWVRIGTDLFGARG